ncbi:Immunoglobulin superfamily containing leucine-rich repeat protein [Bienertia sinuspersici]
MDDDRFIIGVTEFFRRRLKCDLLSGESMNEQKKKNSESKKKMGSLSEVLGREKSRKIDVRAGGKLKIDLRKQGNHGLVDDMEGARLKNAHKEQMRSGITEEAERELTLAEMKVEALKNKLKEEYGKKKVRSKEERLRVVEEKRLLMLVEVRDMEVMAVEDSDFYAFDEDRVERSFKKGQIWAIYDDDDGMPRHYGLIDEVVSLNPFEVRMSWLDLQIDEDERLTCREKLGFHISCGTFEVARKDTTNLLNIFSHVVECERAARKLYRIYPNKGSIWALYNERALDVGGEDSLTRDKRCYDVVVFLTSYSEMHGLSMAYLEKIDGFRAVFKRREIGFHAIRWLDKDDFRLFSHQVPAKKLSGEEAPHISGECWELDPASLPPDLLTVTQRK